MADLIAPLFQLPHVQTREVYRVQLPSGDVVERDVETLTRAALVDPRAAPRPDPFAPAATS